MSATAGEEWKRLAAFQLKDLVSMRCPTCGCDIEDHTPGELSGCIHVAAEGDLEHERVVEQFGEYHRGR